MKLMFEGTYVDIVAEVKAFLASLTEPVLEAASFEKPAAPVQAAQGPGPDAGPLAGLTPLTPSSPAPIATKPKPIATKPEKAKDPAMAERMAKMRAARDAKKAAAKAAEPPKPEDLTSEFMPPGVLATKVKIPEPKPPITDPVEIVAIRQKTIEDLQQAYANGHQQEVFELLSRFGNGAKSFRELTPDAFLPIREAIDNGALT